MLELLQSAIDFSWSMSLLGLQEMSGMLHDPASLSGVLTNLTNAAEAELDSYSRSAYQAGRDFERSVMQTLFPGMVSPAARPAVQRPQPMAANCRSVAMCDSSTGPEEKTLVRISRGTGTVRHSIDGQSYFIVHGKMQRPDGQPDGEFDGVWAAKIFTPADLVSYPPQPARPFDRPPRPGEQLWNPGLNPTKSKWMFGDGAWLESTGPALSRIQIQGDGKTQFWYSVAGFVTTGGGTYQGYRGQVVSLGSAYFQAPPQPLEGLSFELNATHVLKLARVRQGTPPGV